MKINVGSTDRVVRIAVGLALLLMVVVGPKTPWGFVGLIPLATGLFGRCGLYSLLGLSTAK